MTLQYRFLNLSENQAYFVIYQTMNFWISKIRLCDTENQIYDIKNAEFKVTFLQLHMLTQCICAFVFFRWPVVYFATNTATTHQLYMQVWDVIEQIEARGFCIDYVMMDGGSANRSLMSLILGENPRDQGFTTPNVFDFTRSISLVQDIKHCFKKIRNGIESSKLENQSSKKGRFLKLDGQPIVWEHFEGAFDFNTQSGLRIHRHLTKEHVTLTPSNKMRNNLATQVLDKDMLYLMKAYQASLPQPEKLGSTVNLLESTSTLVEFFMDQNRPVCHKDSRLVEVEKALSFFNAWEGSIAEPRNLLSRECRDDLNSAVTGFTKLCDRVLADGDLIKPGYFNSDIVENFFCQQRGIRHGSNTNPTVLQYGPAVNAICLGQTTVSRKSNSSTSAHYFKATTPGKLSKR